VEGLAHDTDCLESLAWRCTDKNPNGFHQMAGLLDLLLWVDEELEQHRKASAYGPGGEASPLGGGTISHNTIGRHGLNRPTEARLDFGTEEGRSQRGGEGQPPVEPNDKTYRDLRQFQRDIVSTLTSLRAQYEDKGYKLGGWPQRTSDQATG
jgi:hypothetical protein